ncbi:MAG: MBL fold metallo-hydrolase [Acidimicrobiales bacterium]|nr:MBL fold metallo-hydrolase [Acidimicrobiales bacterium]
MLFTQYYLDCLSHASYLIGDETTGRAVVVDPRRDVDEYVRDAAAAGMTIELVIETHFHADFLSGHLELAAATGAQIAFSSVASPEFAHRPLADGERISLGEVVLEARHTPGHTPESLSIVVWEHADDPVPYGVLTGDTLFIGDVGRPDLLASIGFTKEELAQQLYVSVRDKLMVLPDATKVFPAHGAGSACGKNLSTETVSTIGEQRRTNYAVQPMTMEAFVDVVTEGQPAAPGYFVYDAILNRQDRDLLDEDASVVPMDLATVDAAVAGGALLVDTRDNTDFAAGHLIGAVNVGLDGRYAEYAGSVVAPDRQVVLVVEPGQEEEARIRLARIGFDHVVGYLADPLATMAANPDRVERASRLTAGELADVLAAGVAVQLVDVRNPGELADGTIDGAVSMPMADLPRRIDELDPTRPTVVFCAGGYRSSVAASLLRSEGFADVSDLLGGFTAWVATPATV